MKFSTRELVTMAVFGTLWGLVEMSLGTVLKSLNIPLSGVVLSTIGLVQYIGPSLQFLLGFVRLHGGRFAGQLELGRRRVILDIIGQIVRAWQRLATHAHLTAGRTRRGKQAERAKNPREPTLCHFWLHIR